MKPTASEGSLQEILARQESSRGESLKRIRNKAIIGGLVGAIVSVALVLLFPSEGDDASVWLIPLVVTGLGGYFVHRQATAKFKAALKTETVPLLLKEIDASLVYDATGSIPRKEFAASELFKGDWDGYQAQDLISGSVGQTALRFCMLSLQATERDLIQDNDSSGERTVTVFEGLLFVADFNKNFSARTFINQETGSLISDLFGSSIELEDPEFNRMFEVRSSDPVEARYLLSPSLMERLKRLRQRNHFRAAFKDGHLWMMLEMPAGAFDPDLTRPLTDASQTVRVLENLQRITGIVEELDLNNRIWTKV